MKFAHFRSKDDPQHRVISVGYILTPAQVLIQVAKCQAPDTWGRPKAHWIIEGRFKKYGPRYEYDLPDFDNPAEKYKAIYKMLEADWHPDFGAKILDAPDAVFELEDVSAN